MTGIISGHCPCTVVCVDKREQKELVGRAYGPGREKSGRFSGLLPLVLYMEKAFDSAAYPQRTFAPRSFFCDGTDTAGKLPHEKEEGFLKADENGKRGEKATFVVQVQLRQNATWQGSVEWLEEKKRCHFRSTLELLRLMDSAVPDSGDDLSGWESMDEENQKEEKQDA